jgi:hypothetical protein
MNRLGYPDTGEAVLLTPGHVTALFGQDESTEWLVAHGNLVQRFKTLTWCADEDTHLVVAYLSDGRAWISSMKESDMILLLGTCFPSITHEKELAA